MACIVSCVRTGKHCDTSCLTLSCVPTIGGVAWQQLNEKITSWQSAVDYCHQYGLTKGTAAQGLCPYELVCPNGASHVRFHLANSIQNFRPIDLDYSAPLILVLFIHG